jgi:hypothetical protein
LDEQLNGSWLPEIPLIPTQQAIQNWSDEWSGRPSRARCSWSPPRRESWFIGIVGFADRGKASSR